MLHGTLFAILDNFSKITLSFYCDRNQKIMWVRGNIRQYIWNEHYFLFLLDNMSWNYFIPSILMRENVLGFYFLDGYFIKKNPYKKQEEVFSYIAYGDSSLDIGKFEVYDIIYNDDFIVLGDEGYRRVIVRNSSRKTLGYEFEIFKEKSFSLGVSDVGLVRKPLDRNIFFQRAEVFGKNIFKIV